VLKLRVSKVARVPGPAGVCTGYVRLLQGRECLLQGKKERGFVCHLQGWDYACRAADIKHLSAGSLPGTPVGRAVVLMVIIIR